jgi:PAS domain S-box-containing protein
MTTIWDRLRGRENGAPNAPKKAAGGYALRDLADRTVFREDQDRRDQAQQEIVDAIPIPMTITSRATGRFLYINRPTTEIFGLRPDLIDTVNVAQCYATAEDRARFMEMITRDRKVTGFEVRLRRVDGHEFWALLNSSCLTYRGEDAILSAIAVIDRRKQLEEKLRTAERDFRSIFENAVDGIFQTTSDGRFLRANPALAHIYGYDRVDDMIAGMQDIKAALYIDANRRDQFVAEIELDGSVRGFESQIRRRDGKVIWISENARTVRDARNGQVLYYEGTVEDVTARKALEARVQQNEALLRNILESAPVGLAIIGRGGLPLYWNAEFTRQLGMFTLEDVSTVDTRTVYRDPAQRERIMTALRNKGSIKREIIEAYTEHSGTFFGIASMERITFEGQPASLTWIIDISERRQAEAQVVQKEAQLRAILEASPIGVMIAGKRGQHMFSNARWRELGGVRDDQVEGLDVRVFFKDDEDRKRTARLLHENGHIRDLEVEVKTLDGRPLWLLLTMERITFEDEAATLSWYYDYSERRQAAEESRLAREKAEAATQAKSIFLATMSHEIRTPMNGVLGMLELLQQTQLNAEQRELSDVIRDSASSLLKIIDDILDFSKIEAGKIEIEGVPMSPLALVEGVADTLAPHAHKKKLQLTTFIDASVPPMVEGDPVRLRQILFNLVGNGIKFTEQGEIVVRVSVDASVPGGMMLRAEISDTGIGLTEEARARLFQPFQQADGSTTRRFGGSGLGLSICKGLVERMGGEIGVNSVPGKGSTFWFTMSVAPTEAPAPEEPDLSGLTVLVIEDNRTVQEVLRTYLAMKGVQVELADSAEEGITLLRRFAAASLAIDAIVVDLKLPGMDGFEFRQSLYSEPGLQVKPCLLLTAYDDPGQRGRALGAGFVAYLTKPVRRLTLLRGLAEACGRSHSLGEEITTAAAEMAEAPPDRDVALAEGRLILVAEDNPVNQMVIQRQLTRLGYAADIAEDGRQALERFQIVNYGMVITDVHMPEMDGLELTEAIRALERADDGRRRVPIIALTANVLASEAERCLAAGMDDHLGKPVALAQLRDALAQWLPRAGGTSAAPASAPAAAPAPVTEEIKILDLERMREIFGEIDGTAITLLQSYVESTGELLAAIAGAVGSRTDDEARKAVHSVKGASRSAGADEVAALCTELETALKGGDWHDAAALQARLGPAFERVKEAVARLVA